MPIYEFTCQQCDAKFEKLVRMSSEEKFACPTCGSKKTGRAFSMFAVGAEGSKVSSASPAPGMCHCGRMPGSCGMG